MADMLRAGSWMLGQGSTPVLGFIHDVEDVAFADVPTEAVPSTPWPSFVTGLAAALRPGAANFTCSGARLLQPVAPLGVQEPVGGAWIPVATSGILATNSFAGLEPRATQDQPAPVCTSSAEKRTQPASPFAAPACQLPLARDAEAQRGPAVLQLDKEIRPLKRQGSCGDIAAHQAGDAAPIAWPASPARQTMEAVFPLAGRALGALPDAHQLVNLPPLLPAFVEPVSLQPAQPGCCSGGAGSTADGEDSPVPEPAAAQPQPHQQQVQQLQQQQAQACVCHVASSACLASSADAGSGAVTASSRASLACRSGVSGGGAADADADAVSSQDPSSGGRAPPLGPGASTSGAVAPKKRTAGAVAAAPARKRRPGPAAAAPAALAAPALGGVGGGRHGGDSDDDDGDADYDAREPGSAAREVKRGRPGAAPKTYTGKARTGVTCRNCSATQTPQWRCGPEGPRTLCNACGVRFKKGLPLRYLEDRKKRQMGL